MDELPKPRRSFWRFSLREMLLAMLAIAAFLGWGRAIYQRYQPFVPTPFATKLDVDAHVRAIRQQLGETPPTWQSSGVSTGGGTGRYERVFRVRFPLQSPNADAFFSALRERLHDEVRSRGCWMRGGGGTSSGGDYHEFQLSYEHQSTAGTLRTILIFEGGKARLLVFVEEHRQSP